MTACLTFCGEHLLLDPAGALVWPRVGLLAVADLHLEKGSACARNGALVPPWDSRLTLDRVASLIARYRPQTVISVGDAFHDAQAAGRLPPDQASRLAAIAQASRLVWVRGNHDPSPPHATPGECLPAFQTDTLVFRHQAHPDSQTQAATGEISGHFHPKARIATRAGTITRPCFLAGAHRIMLPAFGTYTGGLEIGCPAISSLFPAGAEAFLLGRDKLFRFTMKPAPRERVARTGQHPRFT